MNTYCDKCLLKTHIRKQKENTSTSFCISECSIGKQIKQLGNESIEEFYAYKVN